jgi:hypothetical protein
MSTSILTHTSASHAKDKLLTQCYGCRGANEILECGFPMWGCLLCKTYGDGCGNLLIEYRYREVIIDGQTFVPPQYECLFCKDTKVYDYQVYVESLKDDMWSDGGLHNMPTVKVACHSCCNMEHEKQYEDAKSKVFALDPN